MNTEPNIDVSCCFRTSCDCDAPPAVVSGGRRAPGVAGRAFALGVAVAAGLAVTPARAAGRTERVSVGPGGVQGNGFSEEPSLSADGRLVAFSSDASNLVAGDTNGVSDVFVRDLSARTTRRVSVGAGGIQGDDQSYRAAISADGRHVAFHSRAANLVPGDTNGNWDAFVHDLRTGATVRVSLGPGGAEAGGSNSSDRPAISGDGRLVAFASEATGFVAGDTNDQADVFVHDRETGRTIRASVSGAGAQGDDSSFSPALSADGRRLAFWSLSTNLVPGDTNGFRDVFVRNLGTGGTTRVSLGANRAQADGFSADPAISADGLLVGFSSKATNLIPRDTNGDLDGFLRDLAKGTTRRVTLTAGGRQANGGGALTAMSRDGGVVAIVSRSSSLVPGDTNEALDAFVRDLGTGKIWRVSVGPGGVQGDRDSFGAVLSGDGRVAAFTSNATNLVSGDTNGAYDVFVHTR